MKNKKVIVFDLWQTLADSPYRPSALLSLLSNKTISLEFFLSQLFHSSLFQKNEDFRVMMKEFLNHFGLIDEKKIDEVIVFWEKMATSAYLFDGAEELIVFLRNSGYRLALITNIDSVGYEKFPFPQFIKYFEYTFLSFQNGIAKPDFRCWESVKDYFNVSYSDMIMVGDSFEFDIEPAEKLGLSTIQIKGIKGYVKLYDYIKKYEKT